MTRRVNLTVHDLAASLPSDVMVVGCLLFRSNDMRHFHIRAVSRTSVAPSHYPCRQVSPPALGHLRLERGAADLRNSVTPFRNSQKSEVLSLAAPDGFSNSSSSACAPSATTTRHSRLLPPLFKFGGRTCPCVRHSPTFLHGSACRLGQSGAHGRRCADCACLHRILARCVCRYSSEPPFVRHDVERPGRAMACCHLRARSRVGSGSRIRKARRCRHDKFWPIA